MVSSALRINDKRKLMMLAVRLATSYLRRRPGSSQFGRVLKQGVGLDAEEKLTRQGRAKTVRVFDRHIQLPRSKPVRIGLGTALIGGGLLGFLPILGFWMIPLGILVLSIDLPILLRWWRGLTGGRRRRKAERGNINGTKT